MSATLITTSLSFMVISHIICFISGLFKNDKSTYNALIRAYITLFQIGCILACCWSLLYEHKTIILFVILGVLVTTTVKERIHE